MGDVPLAVPFSSAGSMLRADLGLLVLEGELDISTAPRFKADLYALVDEGAKDIVVDLAAVSFIDSTALGVLIGGVRRVRPAGGSIVLVTDGRAVKRALALTGLDRVFTVCDTREQAVATV